MKILTEGLRSYYLKNKYEGYVKLRILANNIWTGGFLIQKFNVSTFKYLLDHPDS